MSIKALEKEFSDFCARISLKELERNPEIEQDIGVIRRMIAECKGRIRTQEKEPEIQAARRALLVFR